MKTIKNLLLILIPFISISASAEVMQYSLCTLNDGKTMADVQAWLVDWRKVVKSNSKPYELKIFNANAGSSKILPGSQFAIVGTTPTLTTYGDAWDWWYSAKEAKQSRELVTSLGSCGANSIWVSTD